MTTEQDGSSRMTTRELADEIARAVIGAAKAPRGGLVKLTIPVHRWLAGHAWAFWRYVDYARGYLDARRP